MNHFLLITLFTPITYGAIILAGHSYFQLTLVVGKIWSKQGIEASAIQEKLLKMLRLKIQIELSLVIWTFLSCLSFNPMLLLGPFSLAVTTGILFLAAATFYEWKLSQGRLPQSPKL